MKLEEFRSAIISTMASSRKRANIRFTGEQVTEMLMNDNGDDESKIDSETGGLSTGEQFKLNQDLEEESTRESEER